MSYPQRTSLRRVVAAVFLAAIFSESTHAQTSAPAPGAVLQAYQELFSVSQKEKRGLMFYVRGQAIGGAVTKVIGNEAVEIRNQTYGRIVIRIDHIDAVAIN